MSYRYAGNQLKLYFQDFQPEAVVLRFLPIRALSIILRRNPLKYHLTVGNQKNNFKRSTVNTKPYKVKGLIYNCLKDFQPLADIV